MLKKLLLSTLILFTWTVASSDDATDAEAKIREYFDTFNDMNIEKIVRTVYALPVHIGNSSGHRAYITEEDAATSLEALFGQIEAEGWVESVIQEIDACAVAEGLVFAEVRYTRNKHDGEAIAPRLRTNIYVVQKLAPGWRITAFYSKDTDKRMTCSS
jgi:hypothetical protein